MDRDEEQSPIATPEGLRRFLSLQDEAVEAVVGRFDQTSPASYGTFGERGRAACREDIGSADQELNAAATAEGLPIEDPNLHP